MWQTHVCSVITFLISLSLTHGSFRDENAASELLGVAWRIQRCARAETTV